MKLRLVSLLLVLLMVCALMLTACGNEKTEDEIRKENVLKGQEQAYTLSLWIPTNSDANSDAFKARLAAVEEAINDIIASDNTKIKIFAVSDAEYDAKLNEKFTQVKGENLGKPSEIGALYVNTAEKNYPDPTNTEDYFYQLQYPELLANQIDICLIRDYNTYSSLVSAGALHSINTYVTNESASYPRFKKMIRSEFISPLVIESNLYAVPNNRSYATDEYQYILINKELAESAQVAVETDSIKSVLDCEEIINKIGDLNLSGVVPFVGTEKDLSGFTYWSNDGQSLVASTKDNLSPDSIFNNSTYVSYTKLYKELAEKNYAKADLAENETAGVFVYNGTMAGAEKYAKDYYLVKTGVPVIDEDALYGSMFAISEYSINFDRAMSFIYLLNTNAQIRTLLQYGIKDVDYVLDYSEDEEDPKIQLIKDENGNIAYDMDVKFTGNGYITYREDGTVIDDWDYIKLVNHDAVVSSYLHLLSNYKKSNDTAKFCKTCHAVLDARTSKVEGGKTLCKTCSTESVLLKTVVEEITTELATISAEIISDINDMTLAEFEEFLNAYEVAKDKANIEKELASKAEEYETLKPDEQAKKDKIEENNAFIETNKESEDETIVEQVKACEDENKTLTAELEKIEKYDELLAKKAVYTGNATLVKLLDSSVYYDAISAYAYLNKTYNK